MIRKIKCFFMGHKVDEKNTDSGYLICGRCSDHEYHTGFSWTLKGLYCSAKYRIGNFLGRFKRKDSHTDDLPF